ncbi:thioredoxin family protein [uncultured Algibacter sp.]|uniref:thioredoxin family protein n=1 Tax=uncultured Algibacter sp. TaxID=298659 RepID=UPI0032175F00
MKKGFYILVFAILTSISGIAQERLVWHTDVNKAIDIATKENKKMLLFFTGSDWCGWCIKLQKDVLKTADFEKWANDNVVLVELDFPKRTPQDETTRNQNRYLQQMFQVRGYPTVHFVNPEKNSEGKTNLTGLGSTGYVRGGAQKWLAVADDIIKKSI